MEAVVAYATRGSTRFHVPGHKGGPGADPGLRAAIGWAALTADIPQDIEGIDLGPEPTPYQRAELLAAEAHGARRSFFLTNGATQGNHALCLALAPLGAPVVVQRNSHASVIDGLVLSGGHPTFVAPEYEDELGMAHGVTPESLAAALERRAGTRFRAAFIVSPTYYGMSADVAGCAEACHAAGVPLVVDQAWGPHFGFHPELPASALTLGADAVLTSTHKIVGSLTQSAMLHVGPTGRIDPDAVARTVRLVRSTSQSALLMASLDAARRQLALHGEALLATTIAASRRARETIAAIPGIGVIGEDFVGRPGVAGWDPLRIVIDVRGTGCTGYELAAALRGNYDIHVELATHATIVLIVGLDEPTGSLERFAHDFEQTVRRVERPGEAPRAGARLGLVRQRGGGAAARGVPRARRGRAGGRGARSRLRRVDRGLPAGHPGAAARRAHHRASSSPTCASCATRAPACTGPATLASRRSASCERLDRRRRHRPRPRRGRG